MRDELWYLLAVIFWTLYFGLLGVYVSWQKRREVHEGFLLGILFGPLGCLIAALLPTRDEL